MITCSRIQGGSVRATVGGYFQLRLPTPYSKPRFDAEDFIVEPHQFNSNIPANISLVAGDPLLELQANTMYTMANVSSPVMNNWYAVVSWLSDFLSEVEDRYDAVFLDLNPSFSLYTQIALAASDRVILPVMADDSSRRAIQNAFSLIYGLKLPSEIYARHSFATQLEHTNHALPKIHLIVKNRLTQYMVKPASGYAAVLDAIENDVLSLRTAHPNIFSFTKKSAGFVNVRDFQTTGVVAAARGMPMYTLREKRYEVFDQRIQVNRDQIDLSIEHIDDVVSRLQ